MKRIADYFNVTPLKFFQDNRKDLCAQVSGCTSGGGGLNQVYTTDSASITWTGLGTQGSPLVGTAAGASGANPSTLVGLTASNGVATTYMRSDGAPALSQAITPTWTGQHKFTFGANPTGNETIRLANDAAWISFYDTANTTRTGYFQMRVGTGMIIGTEIAQPVQLLAGNAVRMVFGAAGGITTSTNIVSNFVSLIAQPSIQVSSTNPQLEVSKSDGAVDSKRWNMVANANSYIIAALNDTGATYNQAYSIGRTAAVVSSHNFYTAGVVRLNIVDAGINVTGDVTATNLTWTSSTGVLALGALATDATIQAPSSATGAGAADIGIFGGSNTSTGAAGVVVLGGGDAVSGTSGGVTITSGSTTANNSTASNILIAGGQGAPAGTGGTGGSVTIRGGVGTGTSGSIILQTAPAAGSQVTRLQINGAGAWLVNATAGTAGQALVSAGSGSTPVWTSVITSTNYTGGKQAFTADGVITVVTITHNMALASSGGGQFMPTAFTLTTTEPIASNHLNRTITFPTTNTMVITFAAPPTSGENANYIWTILR